MKFVSSWVTWKKQIQELSDETPTDKVVPNEFQVKI